VELLVVDCEIRPDAVLVRAKGEVDSVTVNQLVAQLDAGLKAAATHTARLLIIDLRALTHFGSAGLTAVLECHRQGIQTRTSVRLVADNNLVVRVLQVTNMDSVLELYRTVSDALEASHPGTEW